jgi:hypothetical protein
MTAIGIMGEHDTDCRTLAVLLRRMIPREVGIEKRAPAKGGCAALRRAAGGFMKDLLRAGCSAVALVHDLDRNPNNGELNSETTLRTQLEAITIPSGLHRHVCIPVEELEAWFWADQRIIDIIGRGHGKASRSPHTVRDPKGSLRSLSAKAHHKPIYSTNENWKLAESLDLEVCADRCPSFCQFRDFAIQNFGVRET